MDLKNRGPEAPPCTEPESVPCMVGTPVLMATLNGEQ